MDSIFEEIKAEREYQDSKFGKDFDDDNSANDWVAYITAYASAVFSSKRNDWSFDFRTSMVKVAALAVAAIEAYDRRFSS